MTHLTDLTVDDDLVVTDDATITDDLGVGGNVNVTGSVTAAGGFIGDLSPAAETAEHGPGLIGTAATPATYRWTENGVIITRFKIDLTGLASKDTANDVIGLAAGGIAFIRQYKPAIDGIIFKAELSCIETPAGGDDDVNVVVNSSGTLAYDGAGGTTYGINGGDAAAGQTIQNLVQGLTANHYFYLAAGTGDLAAAYTGGMFIFTTWGHALLA